MSPRTRRRQIIAVLVFLAVVVGFTTVFRVAVVHGASMLPTYQDGQIVLVNRLHLLGGPLKKGDVVLVRRGRDVLIKRIAYLPGDVLPLRESLRFRPVSERFDLAAVAANATYVQKMQLRVPRGRLVILGDNPVVSDDSRDFGPLPLSDVLGRVVGAPSHPGSL